MPVGFNSYLVAGLSAGHIFSEHAGLSGTKLRQVGPLQYAMHWIFRICEPLILKITNGVISLKILNSTSPGRKFLGFMTRFFWFLPHSIVLTTDAAIRFVDFITQADGPGGARLAVGPCVCQQALNQWQEPCQKDLVVLYGADICNHLNLGYELISAEKAKELLRKCHQAGLVHQLDFCMMSGKWTYVICNCDKNICVPTRIYLLTGKILWPGPEMLAYEPDSCLGTDKCNRCLERCMFGVNIQTTDKIEANLEACLGCGLCVTTCAGKARRMIKRKIGDVREILTFE